MKKITLAPLSFVGRRSNNQDTVEAYQVTKGVYFIAVADGMGGSVGGKIASQLVINNAKKILEEEYLSIVTHAELKTIIERIFLTAQTSINAKIKVEPELNGMGTTLTCVLIHDDKFVWGNLGDSRTYLLRENKLRQLTVDHTYIQVFLNNAEQDKPMPRSILSQYSNYLLKSLDGGKDEADIFPKDKDYEELCDGDIFLLCSDGLITDKTDADTEIFKRYLQDSSNLKEASEQLISLAFNNGSKDNISVVLLEVGERKRKKGKIKLLAYPPTEQKEETNRKKMGLPKFIGMLAILTLFVLAYVIVTNSDKQTINKTVTQEKGIAKREIKEKGKVADKTNYDVNNSLFNEFIKLTPKAKDLQKKIKKEESLFKVKENPKEAPQKEKQAETELKKMDPIANLKASSNEIPKIVTETKNIQQPVLQEQTFNEKEVVEKINATVERLINEKKNKEAVEYLKEQDEKNNSIYKSAKINEAIQASGKKVRENKK